jgi:hypothetical protein
MTVGGHGSNTNMAIIAALPPIGVEDLDAAAVLACAGAAEAAERRAGLAKLELALQWCVLHPATTESGAAVWGDAGLPGLSDCEESLGGDGCPAVAAYAPEPFATALGVSTFTGMQVLADGLDLAHRLPLTWRRVRALEVAPWRARRLAQATHHLSRSAARYVDAQLAARIDSCGAALIDRTVASAAATYDPQAQAEAEQAGKQSWDVRLLHRTDGAWAGTSHLGATGDTVDLTKFYDLVCDHAAHFARLGDTDDLGVRKAKALGVIADHQSQLDLYGSVPDQEATVRRPSLAKTRLYLHLRLTDLLDLPDGPVAAGEVERLGAATTAKIKEWLGATRATIVPVLDLGRDGAVDEHDPPEWMRETVILRDRHCVFPWCGVDARRCDLDHIEPYVALDEGGPPGRTSPSKLAALCRRHHRAKTARRWRYYRNRDGTYTWHGPYGLTYLVTPLGTSRLPRA